jgi:hypothetical protein
MEEKENKTSAPHTALVNINKIQAPAHGGLAGASGKPLILRNNNCPPLGCDAQLR